MSKHDTFLTEIVYDIDDIIYDFYQKSNQAILKKRNQAKLFEYRDKTIETVNDMNVRSLEMIARLKKSEMVEERSKILVERNQSILDSALDVINASPSKGDFMSEVKEAATQALDKATDVMVNITHTEAYKNLKEGTTKGYERLRDKVKEISQGETVQKGLAKAKDIYEEGTEKVKDWTHKVDEEVDELVDEAQDAYKSAKDTVEKTYEEAKDTVEDTFDEAKDKTEKTYEEMVDKAHKLDDKLDGEKETVKDVKDELKKDSKNFFDKAKDRFFKTKDDVKSELADEVKNVESAVEKVEDAWDDATLEKDALKDDVEAKVKHYKYEVYEELQDEKEDFIEEARKQLDKYNKDMEKDN